MSINSYTISKILLFITVLEGSIGNDNNYFDEIFSTLTRTQCSGSLNALWCFVISHSLRLLLTWKKREAILV